MAKRNADGYTATELCRKCWQAYEWASDDVKAVIREMVAREDVNDNDPHPKAWHLVELWRAGWARPNDSIVPELEKLLRYISEASIRGNVAACSGFRWVIIAEGVAVSVSVAPPSHGMPIGYRVYKVAAKDRATAIFCAKERFAENEPGDPYDR